MLKMSKMMITFFADVCKKVYGLKLPAVLVASTLYGSKHLWMLKMSEMMMNTFVGVCKRVKGQKKAAKLSACVA